MNEKKSVVYYPKSNRMVLKKHSSLHEIRKELLDTYEKHYSLMPKKWEAFLKQLGTDSLQGEFFKHNFQKIDQGFLYAEKYINHMSKGKPVYLGEL